MNREETIKEMNQKGSLKQPFFFLIDFRMENCIVLSFDEAQKQQFLFNFNGISNYTPQDHNYRTEIQSISPVDFSLFNKAFSFVQEQLRLGNSYLVNLTFPTPISVNRSFLQIFHSAKANYKLLVKDKFVVFSPETFVKIDGSTISTFPMKGTIDASVPKAIEKIITDKKEMAEHATVVDLLRNDLSRVAENVRVKRYRFAQEIVSNERHLIQISSEIQGELPLGFHSRLGNIIFEMLPAGSVTGAPKKKTLEIITEAEKYERGYYTGISGYFDGRNLDSCVLIRFIENFDGQLIYKSGGGITSQSNASDEYLELINKIYVPIS